MLQHSFQLTECLWEKPGGIESIFNITSFREKNHQLTSDASTQLTGPKLREKKMLVKKIIAIPALDECIRLWTT